jgi:hypothetical protein
MVIAMHLFEVKTAEGRTSIDYKVQHGFTALRLYGFTALRLYGFTALRLYGFTALRLYGFTAKRSIPATSLSRVSAV